MLAPERAISPTRYPKLSQFIPVYPTLYTIPVILASTWGASETILRFSKSVQPPHNKQGRRQSGSLGLCHGHLQVVAIAQTVRDGIVWCSG